MARTLMACTQDRNYRQRNECSEHTGHAGNVGNAAPGCRGAVGPLAYRLMRLTLQVPAEPGAWRLRPRPCS